MKENTGKKIPSLSKMYPDIITPMRFVINPKKLFNSAYKIKSDIFTFNMVKEPWIFFTGAESISYFSRLTSAEVDPFEFRLRMVPLNLPFVSMPDKIAEVSRATNDVVKTFFDRIGQEKFSEVLVKETTKYLHEHLHAEGTIPNFHRFIVDVFTHVLSVTFLGQSVKKVMPENIGELYADVEETVAILPLLFTFLPEQNSKQKRSKEEISKYLLKLIAARREEKDKEFPTVLDGYMGLQELYHLDDGNVAALFNAFIWAAIHYSSVHACWLGIEILSMPNLLEELLSEQAPLQNFDHADIKKMHLLHGAVKESIRINSIFAIPRRALKDLEYQGYKIPKGSVLSISPYLEHHNEANYKNPTTFDPYRWGRWDEDTITTTFLPGGMGYFGCLGMTFTLHFITVFWGVFLREYHLELVKKAPKMKSHLLLLPPHKPVEIRYKKR